MIRFVLVKSGLRFCSRCKFTHIFCNTQLPFYRLWNKTHHSWLKCSKFVLNLLKLLLRYHYLACDGFAGYYGFHYIYASGQAVERYGVAFCLCYNSACCLSSVPKSCVYVLSVSFAAFFLALSMNTS